MYLPNLMTRDVHHLWMYPSKEESKLSVSILERKKTKKTTQNNSFAPPLTSYSSETPGSTSLTRNHESRGPNNGLIITEETSVHQHNLNYLSHQVSSKLNELDSYRTLGFNYLQPPGISTTMKMRKAQEKEQKEHSHTQEVHTTEQAHYSQINSEEVGNSAMSLIDMDSSFHMDYEGLNNSNMLDDQSNISAQSHEDSVSFDEDENVDSDFMVIEEDEDEDEEFEVGEIESPERQNEINEDDRVLAITAPTRFQSNRLHPRFSSGSVNSNSHLRNEVTYSEDEC
ncbi:Hypothetical protein PP7435_CHR1-0194 [Komagataella phaffii CBS 7435]|nr:GQ67_02449T0 [Komagataella phaffii]AOA66143.1 GQ68_02798T0 [Komagataella phaffii GS115]CAH2445913.1 Hypothetical protein BQ9382_C1-1040 [Komagataella phaffii CBS 7435]CCA36360.1 Hypothetical protein PP7435_CHR1-0194 [Komagataella phaffii CBS 7435]